MTKYKIIFDKFQKYTDILKALTRVTNLVLVLYKIDESFAINYLHSRNIEIFNSFLRDINFMNKMLKLNFNKLWDDIKLGNKAGSKQIGMNRKLLNICGVLLQKKTKERVNFWKMVQNNNDLFKIL